MDRQDSERDTCGDCGPFLLDAAGSWTPGRIRVQESPIRRSSDPQTDALIEDTWLRESASARRAGRLLYDGRLCRLVEHRREGDVLLLRLGPTSFKEFLGTNLTHAYLRHTVGPEALSNALGVSAAVCTSDGFVLLGRRSQKVAAFAGRVHAIGGMVEAAPPGRPAAHPSDAIARELEEELGICSGEVQCNVCLGIIRDRHILQPEMVFDIRVSAGADRLRRFTPTAQHQEHSELVPLRDHPTAFAEFIERSCPELTPVAVGTLLLHGLGLWGAGWFATARGYLRSLI